MIINSLNDIEKFFDSIWMEFKSIITDLQVENNYDKNDLEIIHEYIKRYVDRGKKDIIDEIKKGKKYRIPEDNFIVKLTKEFEESIDGQGLFRSLLLHNGNQILKEIIFRIKQNKYSNNL
jgi:hypothetical protein